MYTKINVVADEDVDQFKTNISKSVDEMQKEGLVVETQYTTTIQHSGRALHSVLILGKKKSEDNLTKIKARLEQLSDSAILYDFGAETVLDMAIEFVEELQNAKS